MPCTVPRLPGLIHCVQLLTLLLPLAQWSDYNKAPLCRLPVIIPSSPTCPSTSSSPSLHRIPSKPSERVRVQDLLAPFSTARPALSLTISDFYILYSTIPVSCLPACLIRFKSASLSVDPPDDPVPGVPVRASYNFLSCYSQACVPTLLSDCTDDRQFHQPSALISTL